MKKKIILLVFLILLLAAAVLSGCAGTAEAPEPVPETTRVAETRPVQTLPPETIPYVVEAEAMAEEPPLPAVPVILAAEASGDQVMH